MELRNSYFINLIQTVIGLSVAGDWYSAVEEWYLYDVEEDEFLEESCICGKENLRYLFTIRNEYNGNTLFPIGSSCIKKFERSDLNEEVAAKEQLFKLLHAIENNEFLSLSSNLFTRKLLLYLYEIGAFTPTTYNRYNPENDYQFMLDMFNKRNRMTERQENKTTAIILSSIKPFLRKILHDKIRKMR
ncbi:MAG: hypothetical protein LBC73_05000 [Oscillospiraceae bacterium]|nr:hypothetical protein [Oscillospiraceae bacterium]